MSKRNEINANCPPSSGNHPHDPENWKKRLAEARARREVVLLHRSSKANHDEQTSNETFSEKGILSRMALARARRKEVLSRLTDAKPPKGPRLVPDNHDVPSEPAAGKVSDIAGRVVSPNDSAAARAKPKETVDSFIFIF